MIRLAIEWDARFEVRDDELQRGGVSYTIDTARALREEFPGDTLLWIIGDDQARQLGAWSRIEELAGMVEFIVLDRPGHEVASVADIPGLRLQRVASHRVEVSSTELRERARRGLSLHYFVPLAVNRHIAERGLYRE
jgi:nicotinate-nucleotide adenylyltransferase